MNKVHALTALSLGILASSSGVLQVQAATYNFFVDFSTKEVANFTAYNQTYTTNTYNLDAQLEFYWIGSYRLDSCPTAFSLTNSWTIQYDINGSGVYTNLFTTSLPSFPCTTTNTPFIATQSVSLPSVVINAVMDDDANFVRFRSWLFTFNPTANTRTLFLLGYTNYFELAYDFNTTYLFNYFLSDHAYNGRDTLGSWTIGTTEDTFLNYVYTTAGNDEYYIYNSPSVNIGTTRKKYAIDYNQEFFRGESVGAAVRNARSGTDSVVMPASTGASLRYRYNYHYLNTANVAQPIVNVPLINFTTQSCSGGFLDINVGCFINNALAYLTNTAPIISDATQLINAGISFAGQTFGVIGAFTTNNMFGYLVLGGFGFIVIKSLFKNDK